jgi:hypothetical protein
MRRVVVVVVSALVAVALAFLLWGSEREPRFQGKTLSAWLLEGAWKPIGLTGAQEEAVRCMGTNALPFLVKWVQYVTPPWRVRLTMNARRLVGRDWTVFRDDGVERARLSLACLQRLGPDVGPAMPEFVKMMKQTNAEVAIRALQIVDSAGKAGIPVLLDVLTNRQAYGQVYYLEGAMGHLGVDGHFAVPALVNCLTNESWGVVAVAARWLGRIRMDPEVVVPALTSCLDAPDARVRYAAIQALGEFRGYARVAMPSVVRELSDPDNEIRAAATNCLYMMETDIHGSRVGSEQGFSFELGAGPHP